MAHKMGLVKITLPYKSLIKTRTQTNSTVTDSSDKVYKTASSQFASGTNTPFLESDGGAAAGKSKVLLFIVNESATIASKQTVADAWTKSVSVARGGYDDSYTINSSRTYWKYVGSYSNTGVATTGGGYTSSTSGTTTTDTYHSVEPYSVSLEPGNYEMKCWGAAGQDFTASSYSPAITYLGGHGGYTKGDIYIPASRTLYVFTGNILGYNGGSYCRNPYGASGGSGTDIRLTKGPSGSGNNWYNWESRKSRIMVAAGGAAGMARQQGYGDGNGGYGGGLIGGDGQVTRNTGMAYGYANTYGARQDCQGYSIRTNTGVASEWDGKKRYSGLFGGIHPQAGATYHDPSAFQGGWGGGWYTGSYGGHGGGSGGSSYISGHAGCLAVTENATEVYNELVASVTDAGKSRIQHRSDDNAIDRSTHFSGLKFTNTVMIDGGGYQWTTSKGSKVNMPTFSGSGTWEGNPNTVGYAKITTIPDD